METKICTKCKEEKEFSEFGKHPTGKFGLDQKCKKCTKEYRAKYYSKNKDVFLKRLKDNKDNINKVRRERYSIYKDFILLRNRIWENKNKEYRIAYKKEYREQNKEILRPIKAADAGKRRSLKKQASPLWADLKEIKKIYKECNRISKITGVKHHVDHIIPLKGKLVSGLHVEYNLRIIPASENLSKYNAFIEDLL